MLYHCIWIFIERFDLISVVIWVGVHILWQIFITDTTLRLVVLRIKLFLKQKKELSLDGGYFLRKVSVASFSAVLYHFQKKLTTFPRIFCNITHKAFIYADFYVYDIILPNPRKKTHNLSWLLTLGAEKYLHCYKWIFNACYRLMNAHRPSLLLCSCLI